MKTRIFAVLAALVLSFGGAPAARAQLDKLSNQDAVAGLKAALEKGSTVAVAALGRNDGFFGNPQVKIPLPDSLKSADKLMRGVGMGKYPDQLILTMNRAAEAAVPEAKQLFLNAVRNMSVQDAKGILTGGSTAGTEYFKRATSEQLRAKFLPVVKNATQKALDGLFFMVGEEEKKIRANPVQAGSDLLKRVFGALK